MAGLSAGRDACCPRGQYAVPQCHSLANPPSPPSPVLASALPGPQMRRAPPLSSGAGLPPACQLCAASRVITYLSPGSQRVANEKQRRPFNARVLKPCFKREKKVFGKTSKCETYRKQNNEDEDQQTTKKTSGCASRNH
ncbi:hypothetical protein NDU88_007614 [Pleurodeles waltl]|uniref:Uncharacterized protein n=1 Tax=Pleurodeles waltl TaxID=8319 RepID=A0AAV7PRY9_PLEWA|nr:hypothetical protein NDU88_007614 [Pleurodeles waltl]